MRLDELKKPIDYFLDSNIKRQSKDKIREEGKREQISRKTAENKEQEPKFWCWRPRPLMRRMLSQSSRFVFSPYDISKEKNLYYEIDIEAKHKEDLLRELEQQQGLKAQDIFSDIHGLASVNARGTAHRFKQYKDYLQAGKNKMGEGDFEGAVENFRWADKLKPNDPYILLNLGNARIQWTIHLDIETVRGVLEQAKNDLYKALNLVKRGKQQELQNQIEEKLNGLKRYKKCLKIHFHEEIEKAGVKF